MEYNTERNPLQLGEYGRNIQKLIEYAITIEKKEDRQDVVNHIIHIMGSLNPHLKNVDDFTHLLWDHLHIMSDFKLEADSPYPLPKREELFAKPEKFHYPTINRKYRHYGRNILEMVRKACDMEDEEKKQEYSRIIANYMKIVHNNWNRENVTDETIKNDLKVLSGGQLSLSEELVLNKVKNTRKTYPQNKNKNSRHKNSRNNNNRNKNYSKNR